jgi:hypothetical protein
MKTTLRWVVLVCGLCLPDCLGAERTVDLEALKQELRELKQRTEDLERKLQQIESAPEAAGPETAPPAPPPSATPTAAAAQTEALLSQPWSPSQPIPLMRAGPAYMNLSLVTLVDAGWSTTPDVPSLQVGGHDPNQRGFSLPNTELAIDGAVDPYFKAFANAVLILDEDNEAEIELEEAYLLSSSLPANLQLKAGQFFTEFGRQNQQHPHVWEFVDQPLILNRAFGPDGLRNPGARLSWLAPTPFYSELFLGVLNGSGETAFSFRNSGEEDDLGVARLHGRATLDRKLRGPGDLLFVPRYAASFDLTDRHTLLLGASAAFGPNNTGPHARTEVYGLDAFWKWKSDRANQGFPFVSWQTEALYRRFDAAADASAVPVLPAETLGDWGFYSQVLWGIRPRWVTGLRGEHVTGKDGAFDAADPLRFDRTRVSPNLTWYPSEFSKIRLQYNYDHAPTFESEHSVWLQLEFFLGAHGAHQF